MKKFIGHISLSALVASVLIGCGGGGSGDSLVKLTDKKVEDLGINAAKVLPGCSYTSDTASIVMEDTDAGASYETLVKSLKVKKSEDVYMERDAKRTVNLPNIPGNCPAAGYIERKGTHDNGDDTLVYTYHHYCTTNGLGEQTTINGKMNVFVDGTPSPAGRIIDSTTYSTDGSEGLITKVVAHGKKTETTTHINQLVYTNADKSISATEMKFKKGEKTYTLSGLKAVKKGSSYGVDEVTYNDPDVGSVKIKIDKVSSGATITVTGEDGSKAVFTDNGAGSFALKNGDKDVGTLSCPELL